MSGTPPADPGLDEPSFVGRMAYRLDDVAECLGISRRTLERERSAGRFPPPDRTIGKMPIWAASTIRHWIEGGGER